MRSTLHIAGHPVHPMLVVFPIAFLAAALPADAAFLLVGDPFWARAAFWLLAAGVASGVVAAVTGLVDLLTMRAARSLAGAWSHMLAAVMLLALATLNVRMRWDDPVDGALPWGIAVSAAGFVMMLVVGWLGGTLTFRHGLGNYDDDA